MERCGELRNGWYNLGLNQSMRRKDSLMQDAPPTAQPRLLRSREVIERLGIGRAHFYRLVADGRFPKPIKLGANCARWHSTDVDKWIEAKREERDLAA